MLKIIGSFAQLLTMRNLPLAGPLADSQLEVLENVGILSENGRILEVGDFEKLVKSHPAAVVERLPPHCVGLPGFVDCHTHICFAGSRANDFALRNAGKSYLEIAAAGGGIADTTQKTRLATQTELAQTVAQRATRHLLEGVTTTEVKTGYGLSVNEEIKMLAAIAQAQQHTHNELVSTCLAAHIVPQPFASAMDYLHVVVAELLPQIKHYCNRVDVFVEQKAFDATAANWYLGQAKALGFELTVHADQFSVGGSQVAIQNHALSADHLEASTETEITALARSQTVAVALPGASLGLGMPFAPARKLLDAGAMLAIASDWNPGSAPMGDLLAQAAILATYEKLTTAEVLAAITYRAAKALNKSQIGRLAAGFWADVAIFETASYQEILYQQGKLKPKFVYKKGVLCT